jgi:uroporphyrinogen III methyltransferase/synthase
MAGMVYLVGAGPGDPGLITVRGRDVLARAQVVVYDHLANPRLLAHAPDAEAIYVGKKAAEHSMTQDRINALLVDRAEQGQIVVRLKGGDPFVFGRGGEECLALAAAGIPFEVVPGITAAIAAAAYAGIPVTHRDLNSSFTFITGHEKEQAYQDPRAADRPAAKGSSDIDWPAVARLPCLAFYMGLKSLERICAKLIEHGMDAHMPAAAIQWGTTPRQRTVTGTLETLPRLVAEAKLAPPALTIIGRVVELRSTLNWFETRPLLGKTIIVTRTRQQASDLVQQLEEQGAQVLEAPTIEIRPPADWDAIDAELLGQAHPIPDWLIFTSPNAPAMTRQRLRELGRDARVFGHAKVAAVGQATAQAVERELGLHVDLCPPAFRAESLADALAEQNEIAGKHFLLLRADIARPVLRQRLKEAAAAQVIDLAIYETAAPPSLPPDVLEAVEKGEADWITFTSGSTVKNFLALLPDDLRRRVGKIQIASIGPITSAAIKEEGLTPAAQAPAADIAELVAAICAASAAAE